MLLFIIYFCEIDINFILKIFSFPLQLKKRKRRRRTAVWFCRETQRIRCLKSEEEEEEGGGREVSVKGRRKRRRIRLF